MKTRTLHKALSMLLTAAMVLNLGLTSVFATEGTTPPGVSGVCTHHTEHTEDCGYQQGAPCNHAHTEDCQLYTAPEWSEAVQAIIGAVDDLPNPTDISKKNRENVKLAFAEALTAYEALFMEDRAVFETTGQYKKLIALQDVLMRNSGGAPSVPKCICHSQGGSTAHTDSACPFYGAGVPLAKGRSASIVPEGITVTQTGDFAWNIYANGNPIIVKPGADWEWSYIYIDENRNGIVDENENTPVELPGVYQDKEYYDGYFLHGSAIFGGCEYADLVGDTLVTVDEECYLSYVYGGGLQGDVDGTVNINIKYGEIWAVLGAAAGNTGDVNINISDESKIEVAVYGGAQNGGTVGDTNIAISDEAWVEYVYGGAENGTTGDTNITIDGDGIVVSANGGGNGSGKDAIAVSGDSTITVNSNIFSGGEWDAGGWIYGGGFAATSTTANSTINLNYADGGYYNSYPLVCGAGNMGSLTGNSTINVNANAPSTIHCGGYTGNVKGTTNVNVNAEDEDGAHYGIFGSRGDGNPNEGDETTVTYKDMGASNYPTWGGFVEHVDNIILDNAIIIINGNATQPSCDNLVVGADSSLGVWGLPFTVTKDFTGGGSIIAENGGFLSVGGKVTGVTTLDFERNSSTSSNTEVKIAFAPGATSENFKLAETRTDHTLVKSGDDWKAVKNTAVPLDIQTSGTLTYGETMQVKVTATGNVSTAGKVKLEVKTTENSVTQVFSKEENLAENKSVTFSVPLDKAAGAYRITAFFKESAAVGQAQTSVTVARRPLTISGIVVPSKQYSENTEVNIPFSSFENAVLTGYLSGDSGAALQEGNYFAQLNREDLDVGNNKKLHFAPNVTFSLRTNDEKQREMYNKYYVPAPTNLTIDIEKQILKGYTRPVPIGSIGLGQTLKDITLQSSSTLFDYTWQYPDTKPEIGNQAGYPIICTIKKELTKNYEFYPYIEGYDGDLQGVLFNVRVGVNAESMRKDYYINSGEKQEEIDLSTLQPYGKDVAASDVTLTYKGTNPTENVSAVAFDTATKKLSYTVTNTSIAKKDMAVISFEVTAENQPKTTFKVIISTIERPDLSSIDTAIEVAAQAKKDIIIDERAASSVKKGTKFVSTAEMAALDSAIKTAENAKKTVTTTAGAEQAAKALDDALSTFKAAIKTGTYTSSDSGGSTGSSPSDGNNSTITKPDPDKPTTPTTAETDVNSKTDDKGNATAAVADKDITNAIDKAQKEAKKNGTEENGIAITLNVKTDKNATALGVTLPQKSVSALIAANVTQVTVNNGLSTITLDLAALNALKGGDVVLSVSKMDVKTLSAEAQNAIGSRPVFQYSLTSGGKTVSDFKGGRAGLQIPYTRTTTEQVGNLCGVYVDASGKVNWLDASSYDPIAGMVLISAQHFSTYGIGYKTNAPKFTDVGTHWAKNDIDFVVARGLLTGTSNTTFAPETSMTRGMFVTALGRLAGVDTKKFENTKFTDVKADAYYAPYVAWASVNNIVNGTSDTTFSPDKAISRQEMAVMLVNYSKTIGYKLPKVHAQVTFTDASSIASWAKDAVGQMQMAGILMGKSGNRFDPTTTATRAEVSAMLRRFVELVASIETAEVGE